MRAVHDRYGPPEVLHLEEVERPVPQADDVLVRIRATSVTRSDAHLRAGTPFVQRFMSGLRRPKRRVLGHELAGAVVEVGTAVTELDVGDRVFDDVFSFEQVANALEHQGGGIRAARSQSRCPTLDGRLRGRAP